jgi:HAD superfamily hydrolase (TIGR01459 family)
MKQLFSLFPIADHYDAILMDLWGVVHDGSQLYPGVRGALENLHKQNKSVIMLSNAPRRAFKAEIVLKRLGIPAEWYKAVVTSGEVGYQWIKDGKSSWGKRFYYIGPEGTREWTDADILDGLDYTRVPALKDTDFLLNVGFGSEHESPGSWHNLLSVAKDAGLPMLCLNPDFEVVKITGERYACAGVLAADYEGMGGTVKYFGKPFGDVYKHCLGMLHTSKKRILAIGDGIATDIAGATNFGIDSVLVTGGIIKKSDNVEELCRKYNAVPNYVMPQLAW